MMIDYRRTLDHPTQSEEEADIIIQGVITLITTTSHPLPHLLGMDPMDDIANSLLPPHSGCKAFQPFFREVRRPTKYRPTAVEKYDSHCSSSFVIDSIQSHKSQKHIFNI